MTLLILSRVILLVHCYITRFRLITTLHNETDYVYKVHEHPRKDELTRKERIPGYIIIQTQGDIGYLTRDDLPSPSRNPSQLVVVPFQNNQLSSELHTDFIQLILVAEFIYFLSYPRDIPFDKIEVQVQVRETVTQ